MISPWLIPIRNCIRRGSSTLALRSAIAFWIATAHSTATTTLENSARIPSPAVSMIRPTVLCDHRQDDRLVSLEVAYGGCFVVAHEGAVAANAGGKDGCQGKPLNCQGYPTSRETTSMACGPRLAQPRSPRRPRLSRLGTLIGNRTSTRKPAEPSL